jgi:hypothetical protein
MSLTEKNVCLIQDRKKYKGYDYGWDDHRGKEGAGIPSVGYRRNI